MGCFHSEVRSLILNTAHPPSTRSFAVTVGMAALGAERSKPSNAECQKLLKQLEEEEERYAVAPKAAQGQASRRPRIPSVQEVEERTEGPNWTVSSPAQNLAAALNDPVNREYDLFTRTWGSSFVPNAPLPPSNIPTIELSDFLRYLKETAAVSVCRGRET